MIEFYNGVILVMKMTQEPQGNYNEAEHRYIRGKVKLNSDEIYLLLLLCFIIKAQLHRP